jgi:predicted dehydrogenase
MRKLRCAVVGGGRIALSHIPQIMAHPVCDLVAIVEPKFSSRFILRKMFNIATFSDFSQTLDLELDAVFILTPPSAHAPLASNALDLGVAVFVEKPLTLRAEDSYRLSEMAKKVTLPFTVGYVYRHHPLYIELKSRLASSDLGALFEFKMHMLGNVAKRGQVNWRSKGVGAGCLYDYGCHALNLTDFLLGNLTAPSVRSFSSEVSVTSLDSVEFSIHAEQHESAEIVLKCDWARPEVRKATLLVEAVFEGGTVKCDGQLIQIDLAVGQSEVIGMSRLNTSVDFYLRGEDFFRQLDEFVGQCCSGEVDYTILDTSVATDQLIENILGQCS